MKKYIAYYRVSTKKQSLGIDAQKTIIEQYFAVNGGELVCEYEEKESGKNDNRPILKNALAECKKKGCTLIVAKVDRLTRDLAFGALLCKSNNIEFCDHPNMSVLEQGIFFALAQQERELISMRTKQALAELKNKGVKLGNPNLTNEQLANNRIAMCKAHKEQANNNERNKKAFCAIKFIDGTLRFKASYLNENGFTTPTGKEWSAKQVQRLIERFSA